MSAAAAPRPIWEPDPPPGQDDLPYSDGVPMDTPKHLHQMTLLIRSLQRELRRAGRTRFFIGGNMFLYYSLLQARRQDFRGPDFFVVLDTAVERTRKSWVLWEEDGQAPNVVIELLSPSTEATDRGEKMRIYGKILHVPEYFLFDPQDGRLEGYRLSHDAYQAIPMTDEGELASEELGLRLAVFQDPIEGEEGPWLRWLRPDGTPLPTDAEVIETTEQKAESAQQKAEAAEQKAEAAQQKAEAAQQKAEAAQQKADDLAARLLEYERRFGQLPTQ